MYVYHKHYTYIYKHYIEYKVYKEVVEIIRAGQIWFLSYYVTEQK